MNKDTNLPIYTKFILENNHKQIDLSNYFLDLYNSNNYIIDNN